MTIRKTTGKSKFTKLYRRNIKEYSYGIVCRNCEFDAIIVTFSTNAPKYCCISCRKEADKKRAKNKYWQQKMVG